VGAAEIPDVFVSYSRRDIEIVSRLCDGLRSRGKTVFIDVGERLDLPGAADPSAPADDPPAGIAPSTPAEGPEAAGDESAAGAAAARTEALALDHADERERAEIAVGIPLGEFAAALRACSDLPQ
jgi:hypothetical protein